MIESNESKLVKLVQILLIGEEDGSSITPSLLSEKIELVLGMKKEWAEHINREAVIDELVRRYSVWIGEDIGLKDDSGHQPWLDASRKKDWRYWKRYREMLERDLSWDIADKLDKSTDKILGMLEDPLRPGSWSRRGLVVGHVQSGKTASYTGLVAKAADAQYKVIIVLAGLHNNLRSQTQIRLEEGFLGHETNTNQEALKLIGVGLIDSDISIKPNCATTRADNGDFNGRAAKQLAISPEERPWLFVVKKNKSVLTRLLTWIQNHVADAAIPSEQNSNDKIDKLPKVKKRVTKLPLLIIDDEADNASVDTGERIVDELGRPDEEHDPTTINKLVRRILHSFSRSAYVGYTATPFANIFIHERGETRSEGPDLFPSSFIQNLAAPSNYIGPEKVFGIPTPEGRVNGLPLIRKIDDFRSTDGGMDWMPPKHKPSHVPQWSEDEALPPSLRTAIESFILSCTIRSLRGQSKKHSSMLVHATRFNSVQQKVYRDVEDYVRHIRQRILRKIDHEILIERLLRLWISDFSPTTDEVRKIGLGDVPQQDIQWTDIVSSLPDILSDIDVRMINGTAKDALDYDQNKDKGLKVIAIGGDKLARGLTLEGLCTSYFLRASRMYDTLMQMGRWFGYRPGYLDLCRLYTSDDLIEWFSHISDAAAELREEFNIMASSGATPKEFGLKVQSHPELLVTSQIKMRSAKTLRLSYSGSLIQTISFPNKGSCITNNLSAAKNMIASLGLPSESGTIKKGFGASKFSWTGYIWRNIDACHIVDFLRAYETHSAAHRVNGKVLSDFIERMMESGELTNWTVAVSGLQTGNPIDLSNGIVVNKITRKVDSIDEDHISIGVLLDPRDEMIDMAVDQWDAAMKITLDAWERQESSRRSSEPPQIPSGPVARLVRGLGAGDAIGNPEKALLILYGIDFAHDSELRHSEAIGFGISFPSSKSDIRVEYKANNVLWEQNYGASE